MAKVVLAEDGLFRCVTPSRIHFSPCSVQPVVAERTLPHIIASRCSEQVDAHGIPMLGVSSAAASTARFFAHLASRPFQWSFDTSFTCRSSSTRYRRPPSLRCLKYALCRPPWLFLFLNSYSRVKTIQTKDPTPTPRSSYPASALSRRPLRLRTLSLSNTPSAPAAAPLRVHNLLALSTSSPAPLPTRAGFLNRAVRAHRGAAVWSTEGKFESRGDRKADARLRASGYGRACRERPS